MIEPRTIAQLLGTSSIESTKAAIVTELGRCLVGVKVVGHPGKLDINDVVSKAVVSAPGIAVGWNRCRPDRDVDGGFRSVVDWAAYIFVGDVADVVAKRSISREAVGHAIGARILEILDDPVSAAWGLTGVGYPLQEPAPALVPVMTMRAESNKTDIFVVTWSQATWDEGHSLFGGATPAIAFDDTPADRAITAEFDVDDNDDPEQIEIRAMLREAGEEDE